MGRYPGVLAWVTLILGAAACRAQMMPAPKPTPEALPAPKQPAAAAPRPPLLPSRPLYPPPLPAVVDPRTGAWRQVFPGPEACEEPEVLMRVGKPCHRCGDKLLHPFHGRLQGALLGRGARPADGAAGPATLEWAPDEPHGASLPALPPTPVAGAKP